MSTGPWRRYVLAVLALACFTSSVPVAEATFPGRNGEIAYLDVFGGDYYETDLRHVCADGSRDRRLLEGGLDQIDDAAFSPNGRWLAADGTDTFDGPSRIFVAAVAGSRFRRLSRPPRGASDYGPVWAPEGGAIAFTRIRFDLDERRSSVRIYSKGHGRYLARGVQPAWSVRDQIAFTREAAPGSGDPESIYVVGVSGGAPRRLAAGSGPKWSPDGRRLLFSSGYPDDEIKVISAHGGGLRRLGIGRFPTWSPDGRLIAFVTPGGYAAVISPTGRGLRRLGRAGAAVFSPDSQWLATSWGDDLYVTRVSSGRRHFVTLAPEEDLTLLDWRPVRGSESSCR